jgi:hypothetical protein
MNNRKWSWLHKEVAMSANMRYRIAVVALGMLLAVQTSVAQWQVTLGANANLNTGANLGTLAKSGGTGTRADPYIYTFTTGGLDLGPYKAYTTVDANEVNSNPFGTSFTLNMGGYGVVGLSGGKSLATEADAGWEGAGSIAITNVGDVAVGAIETYTAQSRSAAGAVQIGTLAARAGNIRTDRIYAHSLDTTDSGRPGTVSLYGTTDVKIQTSGGVMDDINARSLYPVPGPITAIDVRNNGIFACRDLLSYVTNSNTGNANADNNGAGSILLDGGSGVGSAQIRNIRTSLETYNNSWMGSAGDVTIRGYAGVTVSNIYTRWQSTASTFNGITSADHAGHVSITNITGSIVVIGMIDMSKNGATTVSTGSFPVPGQLRLFCGGTNILTSLDLSKMAYALLDSGGTNYINGLLSGVNGLAASNLTSIGTALRTPTNEIIYYLVSQNPGMSDQTLRLANLAGTAGAGGTLVPDYTGIAIALTYSTNIFHEAIANNGTIVESATIRLSGDESFTGAEGENFATNSSKLIIAGTPYGLTSVVARTTAKLLTVTWSGQALDHAADDSVTDLSFAFQNGAFTTGPASAVGNSSNGALQVTFDDPADKSLTYSTNAFYEAAANDGSIAAAPAVNITLFNGTFTGSGSGEDFVNSGKVLVSNLPVGLTGVLSRVDDTHLTATLTGKAAWHNSASNVANLTFAFVDDAFVGGGAASVINGTNAGLSIAFTNPTLTYNGTGAFAEAVANNGSIANSFTITLVGDSFTGGVNDDFADGSGEVTVSSAPAGLAWKVNRDSATQLTVSFTGNATAHNVADNANGLTLTFNNDAFALGSAAAVTNNSKSNYSIAFLNPTLTYSGATFYESTANDGTVSDTATITLAGDTFTGNNNDDFSGDEVTVANVPSGLTAKLARTSPTLLTVSFTGNASPHDAAANRTDVTFMFQNSAFTGNSAGIVTNNTKSNLSVLFRESYYVNQNSGSDANNGSSGAPWQTLTNAVARAPANSVISIMYSPHTEKDVTVNKAMIFKGQGAGQTIVQANATPWTGIGRLFNITAASGSVIFQDMTLRHGRVTGSYVSGGAIYCGSAGVALVLQRCSFERNESEYYGGGAVRSDGPALTVRNCTFWQNRVTNNVNAGSGGAILAGGSAAITIANSTFSENLAQGDYGWQGGGGALGVYPAAGNVAGIYNCTFSSNAIPGSAGGQGGAIRGGDRDRVTVYACVFAKNKINGSVTDNVKGSSMSGCAFTNSVYEDAYVTAYPTMYNLGNNISTNNAGLDPVLADNGGPTLTHALLEGSAAIDAGINPLGLEYDQRGRPYQRVFGAAADAGAFEFGSGAPMGTMIILK